MNGQGGRGRWVRPWTRRTERLVAGQGHRVEAKGRHTLHATSRGRWGRQRIVRTQALGSEEDWKTTRHRGQLAALTIDA